MALPQIDWSFWSQPAFMPRMWVKVHYEHGTELYSDDKISDIDLTILAKSDNSELCGAPEPGTGTISLLDFEQELNPTRNPNLKKGLKIEVFLGFRGYFHASQLGPNLVDEVRDSLLVEYRNVDTWAIPFTITSPLDKTKYYRLSFDYELEDGSITTEDRVGLFSDLFYVPPDWPDKLVLALTYVERLGVSNLAIQTVEDYMQPYGVFYAEDWSYDTSKHAVTVEVSDSLNDLLTMDNRLDADAPSQYKNISDFLLGILTLYSTNCIEHIKHDTRLLYTFYEQTQVDTIANLLEASMANLFFLPDGTMAISDYNGLYQTGITLTDDDVSSYDIQQSTLKSNDSALITVHTPTLTSNQEVASFNSLSVVDGDVLPLDKPRIYSVDYIQSIEAGIMLYQFKWDILNVYFNKVGNFGTIVTTDELNGWEWISEGAYQSLNTADSTTATLNIAFNVPGSQTLTFELTKSGSTGTYCTAHIISSNGSVLYTYASTGNTEVAFENLKWDKFSRTLSAGTYTLRVTFTIGTVHSEDGLLSGFIRNLALNGIPVTAFGNEKVSVLGTTVESNTTLVCNTDGMFPYEIKENHYIQNTSMALQIAKSLDASFNQDFRLVTVTLRGGYGLWPGAIIHITSAMYNIDSDYTIINLHFTYAGSISTTLVLQRCIND